MVDRTKLWRLHRQAVFQQPENPLFAKTVVVQADLTAHDHDFMEIAVILSGTGWHVSAVGERPLKPGMAVFLRPGAWHAYRQCRNLRVFNCCFAPDLLTAELAWLVHAPHINNLLRILPLTVGKFGQVLVQLPTAALQRCTEHLKLLARTTRPDAGDPPHQRPAALAHLVLLLDEIARHAKSSPALHGIRPNPQSPHPLVEMGIKALSQALGEMWSLRRLADKLGGSPEYIARLFKTSTGLPPMAYLTQLRMEYAAGVLLRTRRPIGEIGVAVGYFDANLFARRFRATFAISPRDYRRRFTIAPTPQTALSAIRKSTPRQPAPDRCAA